MVTLSPSDQEYETVKAAFRKTMASSTIKSIQRIESLSLWQVCNWDYRTSS